MLKSSSVKIAAGAVVCSEETRLYGDVFIGSKTVIHPTAQIRAEGRGKIIIGECNLIEDLCQIVNKSDQDMVIGNFNVFEVGSRCESLSVGDNNVIECKSRIGPNVRITNGCIISAGNAVDTDEILGNNTVVFGGNKRRTQLERPTNQSFQLDFLIKVLPNYQRLEKPNCPASTSFLTLSSPTIPSLSQGTTPTTPVE